MIFFFNIKAGFGARIIEQKRGKRKNKVTCGKPKKSSYFTSIRD